MTKEKPDTEMDIVDPYRETIFQIAEEGVTDETVRKHYKKRYRGLIENPPSSAAASTRKPEETTTQKEIYRPAQEEPIESSSPHTCPISDHTCDTHKKQTDRPLGAQILMPGRVFVRRASDGSIVQYGANESNSQTPPERQTQTPIARMELDGSIVPLSSPFYVSPEERNAIKKREMIRLIYAVNDPTAYPPASAHTAPEVPRAKELHRKKDADTKPGMNMPGKDTRPASTSKSLFDRITERLFGNEE